MTRKILSLSLVVLLLTVVAFPAKSSALSLELPFGGLVTYSVPCTCSPGNLWVWFTPLYLGSGIPVTGSVTYSPYRTLLYPYFLIGMPGRWHLGAYTPGVQACWMVAPPPAPGCVPLPSAGLMTKVGTNKPF
jgi:hypothetical protein